MARQPGFIKRAPRVDLRRTATLINSDGLEMKVVVLDISASGFRLEVPEAPRIGEYVTLQAERGENFQAQIRWALGTEAGGVFLAPIDWERWSK